MANPTESKNRSYSVRRQIAELIGAPAGSDFSCDLEVVLEGGEEARLESTSNAGFRGIEGWFENYAGERFMRSLGEITHVTDLREDAADYRRIV